MAKLCYGEYHIQLDKEGYELIQRALAIEKEQLKYDSHDKKWLVLDDMLSNVYNDLAFLIVHEFKEIPF